jgi:hypothetical protein
MKTISPDFSIIFTKLRAILLEHASKFTVTADAEDHYCLEIPYSPKFKKGFPVAWVKVSKSYVSFHFMPIYFAPQLQKGLSPALKARMQGKSCFNFKAVDEKLFTELRQLTALGFKVSKEMGAV